jgi:hypothetical protein
MRVLILLLSIFLVIGVHRSSSADTIMYNGVTYELYGFPLQFISRFKQWNTTHIFFGEDAGIAQAFDDVDYSCTWIVKDDHIYLQSIKSENLTANLQAIFLEKFENGLVLADWIDTTLYASYGNILFSLGVTISETIFEYELALKICKGKVISVEKCDNTKTKTLKDDRLLRELIRNNINWENLPESDTIKRTVYVQVISADSDGKIDSVSIVRGVNEIYDREAVRIVKAIPEWPVVYRHGKVLNLWIFPISFKRVDKN